MEKQHLQQNPSACIIGFALVLFGLRLQGRACIIMIIFTTGEQAKMNITDASGKFKSMCYRKWSIFMELTVIDKWIDEIREIK